MDACLVGAVSDAGDHRPTGTWLEHHGMAGP